MKKKAWAILIIGIFLSLFSSCKTATELQTQSINKNISIDAKIAAIDAYGNITLNILTNDLFQAEFDYDSKIILQFSNGYLIESALTLSNNNIQEGQCYIRTVSKDNPITVGIKTQSLAETGTLKIGDIVKLTQLL